MSLLERNHSSPSLPLDLFGMIENQPQNYFAEEENFDRDRKKPRARRASAMGSIPSLQSPSFQEKMASLGGRASPFMADSPAQDISSDLFNSPGSKSSSRKRPVCGSPSSGDDGSTIMSSNTSCRRTFRLSPNKPPNIENPLFSRTFNSFHEVRGMHPESDDEESDGNVNSSFNQHDASFTSQPGDAFLPDAGEKKDDDETEGNEILASMTSLEDLDFLIKSLEKSKKKPSFFGSNLWTVIPDKAWHTARRSAFVKWLTESLHFAVDHIGNGLSTLRIPSNKGRELLDRLKLSKEEYRDKSFAVVPPSQVLIASTTDSAKPGRSRTPCAPLPPPVPERTLDFDLALDLDKLTVNDRPDKPAQQPLLGKLRSSFGSSRPSFDPSVCDPLELPGHETPAPRSSQMVVASTDHTMGGSGRSSGISLQMSVAPMQTLEFVET